MASSLKRLDPRHLAKLGFADSPNGSTSPSVIAGSSVTGALVPTRGKILPGVSPKTVSGRRSFLFA